MKTRSHNKRFQTSLLLATVVLANTDAQAQFNKYRSQTRFNPDNVNTTSPRMEQTGSPDIDSMSPEELEAFERSNEEADRENEALLRDRPKMSLIPTPMMMPIVPLLVLDHQLLCGEAKKSSVCKS